MVNGVYIGKGWCHVAMIRDVRRLIIFLDFVEIKINY
jgi:hypothetical protein